MHFGSKIRPLLITNPVWNVTKLMRGLVIRRIQWNYDANLRLLLEFLSDLTTFKACLKDFGRVSKLILGWAHFSKINFHFIFKTQFFPNSEIFLRIFSLALFWGCTSMLGVEKRIHSIVAHLKIKTMDRFYF